ncbi:MAG: hydroxymethylglutaryl-CoA lyase [Bdellovibrio sp. CG10_big_fil_rev_8_21_14_0_10_47_8]|nr:MAG: hydroxymethylglutaryl-CoA lyase [Bdellovibrio sp. CG10_big_fil_rev_8_21_14_0_10_47_8]
MSQKVKIVEMSLRDGLQNEKTPISVEIRVELARRLAQAGFQYIEIGAFVRADKVPQMAGSSEVIRKVLELQRTKEIPKTVRFAALVPNEYGMQEAISSGVHEVAIFASATESFSQSNINCSIEESFQRFEPVLALAKKKKIPVRGYLSVCFGCPYEGKVSEKKVIDLATQLYKMGCYEVSIGDTIGVASPLQVQKMFSKLKVKLPVKKLAGHFHDTRGTALANILAAYQTGVRVFDSSLGGLGGCPYAPGSSGNVATEDVLFMFEGMGVSTGINLPADIENNHWLSEKIQKQLSSKVSRAGLPKISRKTSV